MRRKLYEIHEYKGWVPLLIHWAGSVLSTAGMRLISRREYHTIQKGEVVTFDYSKLAMLLLCSGARGIHEYVLANTEITNTCEHKNPYSNDK